MKIIDAHLESKQIKSLREGRGLLLNVLQYRKGCWSAATLWAALMGGIVMQQDEL
jgi:hypothetical protein